MSIPVLMTSLDSTRGTEAVRDAVRRYIPSGYRPELHLFTLLAVCLGGAAACLAQLPSLAEAPWSLGLGMLLLANLIEYVAHRGPMHHVWRPFLQAAYEAHSGRHHRFFSPRRMEISQPGDIWLVLFSMKDMALLFVCVLPIFLGLRALVPPAAFLVLAATGFLYFLAYEGLHLICHLPESHLLVRLRLFDGLRARHRRHHENDSVNFNLTFPLGDALFGTLVRR